MPGAPHVIGLMQFLSWVERYEDADAFVGPGRGARSRSRRGRRRCRCCARVSSRSTCAAATGRSRGHGRARRCGSARRRARSSSARCRWSLLARLDAAMGLEDECRASVRDVARASRLPAGLHAMNVYCEAALGLLELGLGRAGRAAEHLDEAARLCAEYGQLDPSVVQHLPDRIEAHIRAGEPERAEAALAEFEAMAERTQRPWPLAWRRALPRDARRTTSTRGSSAPTRRTARRRRRSSSGAPSSVTASGCGARGGCGGARAAALRAGALRGARRRAVGRAGARRAARGGRAGRRPRARRRRAS